jgi:hypothetical protein
MARFARARLPAFVTPLRERATFVAMATPTAATTPTRTEHHLDIENELQQANSDFDQGDFIELSIDEFDRCVDAGVWPWQRESSG